jgi:hypothetical protein
MEAGPRSLPDQWSGSASPHCSSKSLYASSPNTPRYCLLICPWLRGCLFLHSLIPWKSTYLCLWGPHTKAGQVTWTILSPRFRDSPHLFGLDLTQDLAEWQYPQATLLQYVDDLLLCRPTEPVISWATDSLLNFLLHRGYKISKEKTQLYQFRVTYLGLILETEMRVLGEDRLHLILTFLLPKILNNWGPFGRFYSIL